MEEGNNFDDDEPVVANIILPNRPHQSAVQVEEVGSFKLESIGGQMYLTSEDGSASTTIRQGIIDEVDSDTGEHSSTAFRRTIMRNVSIVSATSEDEQQAKLTSGRDVAIDEIERNVEFENGHSHIRVTKTVIEEQQVIEVDDNGTPMESATTVRRDDTERSATISETTSSEGKQILERSVEKSTVETNETNENEEKTTDTIIDAKPPKRAKVWTVENVEEVEAPPELSEEELRKQRIKEIRMRARKGSLCSKEPSIERDERDKKTVQKEEILNNKPQIAVVAQTAEKEVEATWDSISKHETTSTTVEKQASRANVLEKQDIQEDNISADKTCSRKVDVFDIDDQEKKRQKAILSVSVNDEDIDEEDAYMAALLKRGQAQRAALQQILSHEEGTSQPTDPQQEWKAAEEPKAQPISVTDSITEDDSATQQFKFAEETVIKTQRVSLKEAVSYEQDTPQPQEAQHEWNTSQARILSELNEHTEHDGAQSPQLESVDSVKHLQVTENYGPGTQHNHLYTSLTALTNQVLTQTHHTTLFVFILLYRKKTHLKQ